MRIETALFTFLKLQPAITAILGSGDSIRAYAGVAPQNIEDSYLVYNKISSSDSLHLTGHTGLAKATFQFDCWSKIKEDTLDIAAALRVLNGYQGGTWGTLIAESAARINERSSIDYAIDGSERGFFREICEYYIIYREV